MTHLPSLPDDAVLLDVFRKFPTTSKLLMDYHQTLLRGPSPFSIDERELIAAYVSAINACGYCHGVHAAVAAAFGVDSDVIASLTRDVQTAPVDERMKPVLALVRTLTLTPAKVREAEVEAVYTAGWDEQALHDAVSVCALFNFMNRLVEGLGIEGTPALHAVSAQRLSGSAGYGGLRHLFDPAGPTPAASTPEPS